jgi:hypothetical protein
MLADVGLEVGVAADDLDLIAAAAGCTGSMPAAWMWYSASASATILSTFSLASVMAPSGVAMLWSAALEEGGDPLVGVVRGHELVQVEALELGKVPLESPH